MIKKEKLLSAAHILLGDEVCDGIQQWYEDTLQSDARYVVYVVRRCYMLALIMECITGKKMMDSKEREFLTDASFFLRCEELAEYYCKYGKFPKIMLCDDIMIHGRNLNHFLELLEEQLCELLVDYKKEDIQLALVAAVKIHIYVCSNEPLLLLGRYELNLEYSRKEVPSFWREVSSNISTLILRADMANACYLFSEPAPSVVVNEIKKSREWEKTIFQKTEEYTSISYGISNNQIKAIYTIRVVRAQRTDNYRAIPFVFLPNLNERETNNLKEALFKFLRQDIRWAKIEGYIEELSQVKGKRVFNEWLTLLISQTLLNEFNNRYDIELNTRKREYRQERLKLLRNYNAFGKDVSLNILNFTLTQQVLSINQINQILFKNIDEHSIMEFNVLEKKSDIVSEDDVRIKLEDYFYKNAIIEEISAFELSQIPYVPSQRRSLRRVRGCCFTLAALNTGYTKSEMDYSMAIFLQMMDAGVLALSSYASKETEVVGFAQFVKAGEQSLQIYPLRMYEYIPLLIKIERRCELNMLDFKIELKKYFLSEYCDIDEAKKEALYYFVHCMLSVGQMPSDWNGNYLMKIDFSDKEDLKYMVYQLMIFMKKQEAFVESYKKYVED